MRRRDDQNQPESLTIPIFDKYAAPDPDPMAGNERQSFHDDLGYRQEVPQQPQRPQQISTEAAVARLTKIRTLEARQADRYKLAVEESIIGMRRPMSGLTPDDVRRIEANYQRVRRELTGRQPAAITGGGRAPAAQDRSRSSSNPGSSKNGRTTAPGGSRSQSTAENGFSLKKLKEGIRQRKRTSAAVLVGVMMTSAIVAFGVTKGNEQSGDAAAALQTQSRPEELKNDTFAGGTALAVSYPTTNDGAEVHLPVELQEAGHEAYIDIPLNQIKMGKVIIKANGARVNGNNPAVWARLVKDTYVVNRSAIDLTIYPWIKRVAANETQATSSVGMTLLPSAAGLPLIVDGKQVAYTKYPLSTKGLQQVGGIIQNYGTKEKPKNMFSNEFMNTLIAKVEYATILALEDPDQCPTVSQALDKADLAYFSAQESVDSKEAVINEKAMYGKASDSYAQNKNVKDAVASKAFTLNKFNISCDAQAVMPGTDIKALTPAPTKSAPATTKPTPNITKK